MAKKKKTPKQKVVYVDDGSTIADMSRANRRGEQQKMPPSPKRKNSTFSEKYQTFFAAMKMMFIPMLIVLLAMTVGYLLLLWAAGRI